MFSHLHFNKLIQPNTGQSLEKIYSSQNIIIIDYNESLLKVISYFTINCNRISTSNVKLYITTMTGTSNPVLCDTNLLIRIVLLPHIIIIKGIYNSESLKYLSYYSLIYNSISTSNTKVYVIKTEHISKPVPNYTNIFSLMVHLLYFIV